MEDLEIRITNRVKKIDSGLINYLISIRDENDSFIIVNKKYTDVYNIIKKNKYININFENIEYITYLVEGLLYFDNKKILEDVLKKNKKIY